MPCLVKKVVSVTQHPIKSHLDIVILDDNSQLVSMKIDEHTPRYKIGDCVTHIDAGAILQEKLLRELDVWDHAKNKGMLQGNKQGTRMKATKFSGELSEGMLMHAPDGTSLGDDVTELLNITY